MNRGNSYIFLFYSVNYHKYANFQNIAYCRKEKSRTSKYHSGLEIGEVDGKTLKNLKNGINQIEFQTHLKKRNKPNQIS
jgi:hypothetical protein